MARYDGWRGYGREGYGRMAGGYGSEYSGRGEAWGAAPDAGFWGHGVGLYRQWGTPVEAGGFGGPRGYDRGYERSRGGRGYDRGVYGAGYPAFGGYPGGAQRGMYYGGYDREAGYGRGGRGGYGGGYDSGGARDTFVPEQAYRRHPELDRPQHEMRGRWPSGGHEMGEFGNPMDDDEIQQSVRQNLHQDSWIRPDRIQVEVNGGVVTLTGEVDDYMQARYAWDDAWETGGVRGVINNLTVRTGPAGEQHGDPMPQSAGKKE